MHYVISLWRRGAGDDWEAGLEALRRSGCRQTTMRLSLESDDDVDPKLNSMKSGHSENEESLSAPACRAPLPKPLSLTILCCTQLQQDCRDKAPLLRIARAASSSTLAACLSTTAGPPPQV